MDDANKCKKCSDIFPLIIRDRPIYLKTEILSLIDYFCNLNADSYCGCIFESRLKLTKVNSVFQSLIDTMLNNLKLFAQKSENNESENQFKLWSISEMMRLVECVTKIYSITFILNIPSKQIGTVLASEISSDILLSLQTYCIIPKTIPVLLLQNICYFCDFRGFSVLKLVFNLDPSPHLTTLMCAIIKMLVLIVDWLDPRFLPNDYSVMRTALLQHILKMDSNILSKPLKGDRLLIAANPNRNTMAVKNSNGSQSQISFHDVTKYNLIDLVWLCCKIEFINQWSNYDRDVLLTFSSELILEPFIDMINFILKLLRYDNTSVKVSAVNNLLNLIQQCMDLDNQLIWMGYNGCFNIHLSRYILDQKILAVIFSPEQHPEVTRIAEPMLKYFNFIENRALQNLASIARAYRIIGSNQDVARESENKHYFVPPENSCKSMIGVEYFKHIIIQCGLHAMVAFNMEILNKLPTEEITDETLYISQFLCKQMWLFHLKSELVLQKRKQINSTSSTDHKDSPMIPETSGPLLISQDEYCSEYTTQYDSVRESGRPASSEASWGSKKNVSIDDETFSDALLNSPSFSQSDLMLQLHDIPVDDEFHNLVDNKMSMCQNNKDFNESTNYFRDLDSDIDAEEGNFRNKYNCSKFASHTLDSNSIFEEKTNRKRKHECNKNCLVCENDLNAKMMKKGDSKTELKHFNYRKSQEAEDLLKSKQTKLFRRSNSVPNMSNNNDSPNSCPANFRKAIKVFNENEVVNRNFTNTEFLQHMNEYNPSLLQIVVHICDVSANSSSLPQPNDLIQPSTSQREVTFLNNNETNVDVFDGKFPKHKVPIFTDKRQIANNLKNIRSQKKTHNLRLLQSFLRDNNFANVCNNMLTNICCAAAGGEQSCEQNNMISGIPQQEDDLAMDDDCRSTSRSSSSTEDEEIVTNRLLDASFYECLAKPGYTLLWDLLGEKRYYSLSSSCKILAPRLFLQMLESFNEDNIRLLFLKGCIENITVGHSKTISLKLIGPIIRLLSPCRDSRSTFRQFFKTNNVVQILLNELVAYKTFMIEKLQLLENDASSDRIHSEILDEIVLRLEVLGLVFTEINDDQSANDESPTDVHLIGTNVEELNEMADIIWQALIKDMPTFITDITFSWWLSLFKESTNIFISENIRHIIEDLYPTIPPSKLTIMSLELYQCLFRKERNLIFQLKQNIDNDFIWQAAVYAENADVSVMAIKINAMISLEYLKENVERYCLENLSSEISEMIKQEYGQVDNVSNLGRISAYLSKCILSLKNGIDTINRIYHQPLKCPHHLVDVVPSTVDNILITIQRVLNILHSLLLEFSKHFAFSLTSKIIAMGEEPNYAMCFIDSKWNWIKPLYPKSQELSISLILNDKKILLLHFSHHIFGVIRAEAVYIYKNHCSSFSSNTGSESQFCGIVRLYVEGVEIKPENDYKCLQELNISDGCSIIVCKCEISSASHIEFIKSELLSSSKECLYQIPDCYLPMVTENPFNIYRILTQSDFFNAFYNEIFYNLMKLLYTDEVGNGFSTSTKYRLWLLTRNMLEIIYLLSKWIADDHPFIKSISSVTSETDLKKLFDLSSPHSLIINLRLTQNICQGLCRNISCQRFLTILQQNNGILVFINLVKSINDQFQNTSQELSFWLLDILGCLLDILFYLMKSDSNSNWKSVLQNGDFPLILFNLSVSLARISRPVSTNKHQLKSETEIDCLKLTIRLMSSILPCTNISVINNSTIMSDWIRMLVIDCPIKQLRLDVVSFLSNICEHDTVLSLVIFKSAINNLSIASEKCNLIAICKVDLDLQKNKYFVIKDDSCEHNYFDLLRIIIDFFPNNHESYDTTLLAVDLVVKIIDNRTIYEKRPLKFEDITLIGLIKVLRRLTASLISSQHRSSNCITILNDVVCKVFGWMFKINNKQINPSVPFTMSMKFLDLQTNTLPKFKGQLLRRLVFELLLDLCQISTEIFQTLCAKVVDIHIDRSIHDDCKVFALEYWPRDDLREETGFCGIINLGATCYLATTLQHLFMIPDCRKLILECTESGIKWFNKLQSIFCFLQFSERSGLNPKGFCDVYEMNKQVINTGEQKDMSEFFSDLIGKLETVSLTLKNGIKNLFGGESSSYIVSLDCPHQSRIPEEFYFLSLNVNNMTSLQQSFAHFVEKDILDGNNKYRCSDCDNLVRAEKRTCLTKLPSILCLNIMRYYFDVNTLRREKLNNFFEFPMQLDVEPFMKHSLMAVEPDVGVAGNCKYRLIGITVHSGTSESGHYYSFIKDRSDGKAFLWNDQNSSSDKWFCFNDSKVKCFDPTNIPSECFGGLNVNKRNIETSQLFLGTSEYKTNNAYMLFYERVSANDNRKEPKSMEIVIPPNIYAAIEKENQRFLRDCLLFDLNYFQFLLQFGTNVPRLISKPHNELLVTADVGKVCASFILEVLLHSREKPELSQWVELLFRIISSCRPSQLWLIDFMTSKSKWISQYLFLCTDKIVRNLFIRFVQELAKLLLIENDASTSFEVISKKVKQLIKSLLDSLASTTSDMNNISSINMKLNQFDEPLLTGMARPTLVQCGPSNATCSRFNSNNYPDQLENYFDLLTSLIKINQEIMLSILFKSGGIRNLIMFYLSIRFCDSEVKVCAKQSRGQKFSEMKSVLQSAIADARPILLIDNKQMSQLMMQSVLQSQDDIGSNSRNKSYLENLIVIIVEILSHLSHKSFNNDNCFLSKEDAVALLSEDFINSNFLLFTDPCQSMPFLYHQICDTINPSYTLRLLALLISYRKEILPPLICFLMLSASVQVDPIRCQNFLYYLNVLLQIEERCKMSTICLSDQEITRPIEHLVLTRSMDFALLSRCSYQWLNWMSTRCTDSEFLNCLIGKVDDWLYKFLVLDPNSRVRQNTRDLIRALLRSSQESDSDSSDECVQETEIQQKLFNKLLSLLHEIREKRCLVTKAINNEWINTPGGPAEAPSNEPWRQEDHLTAYFNALKDCMYSQSDRMKVNEHISDIWAIYHPGMSVALCPINWEKQALLAFLYRVCMNNSVAVDFLTKTSSVSMPISTNYILSDLEDPTVVNYNRKMLPHFFGILTVCCQRSHAFRLNLCCKCDTIDWCYRHILPHRQYYGSVIDDIIVLTQAMIEPVPQSSLSSKEDSLSPQSKFRRKFLRKHISTELRSKLLLKLCSMLIQDNEDRLTLAMHDGFYALCLAAMDFVNKYCSNSSQESEKMLIEVLCIITQIIRYCLLVIEQSTGTSLRRDIFYRSQGRFKSQMLELATKILHLICSDSSSRQVRLSSIEFVRQVLDVYQKDFLTIITKELLNYQNKLNINNIVNRDTPVFERLINNVPGRSHHIARKDTGTHKMADDKVMLAYFSLVDRVSRMAVNLHRFNSDTITLCLTAAILSYPIACPLFAQFCLEILHSDLITEVEHMMTLPLFHDYILLIISGDVSYVLREKAIIQLLEEVFPKVANSLFSRTELEQTSLQIVETLGARLSLFKVGDVSFDLSGCDHLLTVLYIFLRYPLLEPILKTINKTLLNVGSISELSLVLKSSLEFLFGNGAINLKQIIMKSTIGKESTSDDPNGTQSPSSFSGSDTLRLSESCIRLKSLLDKISHLINSVNLY